MPIFQWIAAIATALFAVNTAYDIGEKAGRVRERHKLKREQRRAGLLPRDVAKELERRVGGRVSVGREPSGEIVLAVFRPDLVPPPVFGGYRVVPHRREQRATLAEAPLVVLPSAATGMIVIGRAR